MKKPFPNKTIFGLIVALGLTSLISYGEVTHQAAVPHYADLLTIDAAKALPASPDTSSVTAQADLQAVLQSQAWRTTEQIQWAKLVDHGTMFDLFGAENLLGPQFSKENSPKLAAFIEEIAPDLIALIDSGKNSFKRSRPFVLDARVQPCVDARPSYSYPSGHTFFAYFFAATLSEIYPTKRTELFDRAARIAWGRVLGGVHFPTDLEAGRRLAALSFALELKNEAFRKILDELRLEASPSAGPLR